MPGREVMNLGSGLMSISMSDLQQPYSRYKGESRDKSRNTTTCRMVTAAP
jgi:hypothetical protein